MVLMLIVRMVYLKTGSLDHFMDSTYHYNHVLNLLAAMGLFYVFFYLKMDGDKIWSKFVCKISPYTLGVYLLHEQLDIRYRWPQWLGATADGNILLFVVRSVLTVLVVFAVGIFVDMMRGLAFSCVKKIFAKKKEK